MPGLVYRHMTVKPIYTMQTRLYLDVSEMTLFQVALKVASNSFLIDLSRRFPSAKIFIWCNREHAVLEVIVKNSEDYPLVLEQIRACPIMGILEEVTDDRRIYLNVTECHCMNRDTIVRRIGELDILNIFPNMIENGWAYHRLIVFKHEDFEELLRRFDNWGWIYKILHKVPFDGFIASSLTLTADALFSDLTEKQIDAFLTAHRSGHYMLPRRADVQTIAARQRVPRTTFQEHLKKAENKLPGALVPYIQLFNHAPIEKRKSLQVA
jgi:predicted DNA binding protein